MFEDDGKIASALQEESNPSLELILQEERQAAITKQSERSQYLGELRERVLRALDFQQAKSDKVYPEILSAIKDPRASRLLIHHKVPIKLGSRYEKPAKQSGLAVTYVSDPGFRGSIGLLVASDDAVDVADISVPN